LSRRIAVTVIIGVTQEGQVELPEIRLAADAQCLGFGFRKSGQEQRRENGDDGDDDQQLDQSEC
jgi:hypothetical protein